MWQHVVDHENKKRSPLFPMLKIKFFKKIAKVSWTSEKTVIFIQNTEDLFLQLDKQFAKAEEAFEII
jgi:transcription-repair coupling factor (superfamily II helicase)